jgi:hypothetical protein
VSWQNIWAWLAAHSNPLEWPEYLVRWVTALLEGRHKVRKAKYDADKAQFDLSEARIGKRIEELARILKDCILASLKSGLGYATETDLRECLKGQKCTETEFSQTVGKLESEGLLKALPWSGQSERRWMIMLPSPSAGRAKRWESPWD